ncbi:protein kinase [Trypanosoma grayi]|uniref:protein kinase n=1 Tax=Trypanosoma grayi TaxID=71804 RepID=UPI0004F41B95|nr:protein kinase [Trypanosoma grayi]KEG11434.1 protein kinase [Trypanosoma grayi]
MSIPANNGVEVNTALSRLIGDAFRERDVARVEESLRCALDALKAKREQEWDTCTPGSMCKSLLHAYTLTIRENAVDSTENVKNGEPMWKWMLHLTVCTGLTVVELCAMPAAGNKAATVMMQTLSELLRPPSHALREKTSDTQLFWRCYPWWCCLLHHCLAASQQSEAVDAAISDVASRAVGWVAHRYALAETTEAAVHSSVDVRAFLAALELPRRIHSRAPTLVRPGEHDLRSSVGGEWLGESVYPMSLGQSIDVTGASIVLSYIKTEHLQRDLCNDNYALELEASSSTSRRSPSNERQRDIPQKEPLASRRALFVAAKLGTLFVVQDLHTLLPLRAGGSAPQEGQEEEEEDSDEDDAVKSTSGVVHAGDLHCEMCRVMEQYALLPDPVAAQFSAAHSLILLHAGLMRAPLRVSALVRRCMAEKAAAAVVMALLRHDAKVADALTSVMAHSREGPASCYFVALWCAALSARLSEPSDTMAWLFVGLSRGIEKYTTEGGEVLDVFVGAVDAAFACMIHAMETIIMHSAVAPPGGAVHRLKDLCVRGFMEVLDALLRVNPQPVGPTLESRLCELILDEEPGCTSVTVRGTAQVREALKAYCTSVVEERLSDRGQQTAAVVPQSMWWPDAEPDRHENCRRVLQHTLTVSEYACRLDTITHAVGRGTRRHSKHPAAFFLDGNEGPCMHLFSMPPNASTSGWIEEVQCVAACIIATTARAFGRKKFRSIFASPFGASSGHYAATYTRLLYLRFLEKVHHTSCSDHQCLRALLRALRSLTVAEKGAHRSAVSLSVPTMLSHMLPSGVAKVDAGGAAMEEATPVALPEQDMTRTPMSVTASLVDELGGGGGGDSSNSSSSFCRSSIRKERNVLAENENVDHTDVVAETTPVSLAPIIPVLSFGALAPPAYYTSNGDTGGAPVDQTCSPPISVPPVPALLPVPTLSPLQPTSNGSVKDVDVSTSCMRERNPLATLEDPATMAELLLFLCCLLPGREGGMIGQSSLAAAHHHAEKKSKRPRRDGAGAIPPFVRVLRTVEEFTHQSENRHVVELFDKLVTEEMQTTSALWMGVDVLRCLLLPQPQLLDGLNVVRRIGSGGYGAVFSAMHSCATHAVCHHGCSLGDGKPVALKLLPVTRRDADDCTTLVSCHTEATALRRLQGHLRICEMFFCGCTGSHYVVAMPFYKGGSLREWRATKSGFPVGAVSGVRRFSLTREESVMSTTSSCRGTVLSVCGPIFDQVLEAVEFMHAHRIRHNDLKADNILIEDFYMEAVPFVRVSEGCERPQTLDEREVVIPTAVRLCDFGVCEVVGEDVGIMRHVNSASGEARWGPTKGTEAVQAPEALALANTALRPATRDSDDTPSEVANVLEVRDASNVTLELAADMWACGCLLYELLTGVMLFGGANLGRLLVLAGSLQGGEYLGHDVLQPHQRNTLDSMGCGITEFVLKLLSVDPAERPSATEARFAWKNLMQAQED